MFIPVNQLKLKRYPPTQDKSLQAWNAADELLIEHLNETLATKSEPDLMGRCLLLNDQFGSLCCALQAIAPVYWSDSFLSSKAILLNLKRNSHQPNVQLAKPQVLKPEFSCKDSGIQFSVDQYPTWPPLNKLSLVVMRVPKHNSLLEFQLAQIRPWLSEQTQVVAAGMTKEIHNSTLAIFEKYLGSTQTSPAKKKARLIFSQVESRPLANIDLASYKLQSEDLTIYSLPGVFSRNQLDIGTQVLLPYLPKLNAEQKAVDLGCGNGVIGALIAKQQPLCQVYLTDESWLAVASAKLTFSQNNLNNGHFFHTDSLHGLPEKTFDYIFCNPPFHQQNTQTLDIAIGMFKQAAQRLKPGGELLVVANRHLKYQGILSKNFSRVQSLAKDSQFSVWQASSPRP